MLREHRITSSSISAVVGAVGRREPLWELESKMDDTIVLKHLVVVAKTAKSVYVHLEKFRDSMESGKINLGLFFDV